MLDENNPQVGPELIILPLEIILLNGHIFFNEKAASVPQLKAFAIFYLIDSNIISTGK